MDAMEDAYLGDGVYASFDGYHIVLDLRGQDDSTRILLEPKVIEALLKFRKLVNKRISEGRRNCPQGPNRKE